MPAALDYYESRGQNWERAAMIKARPCAGDLAAGERMLAELSPFIWRKYLDFVALADIHAMKRQIQAYRGHGEVAVEGHNVKLGRGGIREIEFFVQTQQLIAGGRHPALRGRETLSTLEQLSRGGWIDAAARDDLDAAYAVPAHRRASPADGRRRADPHAALERERSSGRSPGSWAIPTATPSRRRCSAISAPCSATMRGCSRTRPRAPRSVAGSSSRPKPTPPRRSTS